MVDYEGINLREIDREAFSSLVEKHRYELQVHSYRMLGSLQDAEDMVQESFLRAWRGRETFEGRASVRAWLYKICTNVCLDTLKRKPRRYVPLTREAVSSPVEPIPPEVREPIWLEPYPDHLLALNEDDPEERLSAREQITLAFVAALHLLPPRQRAVLLLCDVLDWQAGEAADVLDTTVSAVKSALHRARSTLAAHGAALTTASTGILDDLMRGRLNDYVRAWEQADVDALVELLKEDATFSMPPIPSWYRGKACIRDLTARTIFSGQARGRWRLLPTHANRQPAFGLYRQSSDDNTYDAYGIQVLSIHDHQIADIITFRSPGLLRYFDLPPSLT